MDEERHDDVTYVEDSVSVGLVLRVAAGTGVISVVLCLIAWAILRGKESQLRPSGQFAEGLLGAPHPVARVRQELFARTPSPGQSTVMDPRVARSRRALDQARLDGYGWIDRGRGIVRIPIDRAFDLVLGRGEKDSGR